MENVIMGLPISSFSDSNAGEEVRLGDQVIRHDRFRTIQAYETVALGGADQCTCSYCRNFVAQRGTLYPGSFVALLDQFGIDLTKEGEVYELGPAREGIRHYGGWFFFVGQILEVGESWLESDGISYQVGDGEKLPRPDGDFGLDLLALNFNYLSVPWVLEEEA